MGQRLISSAVLIAILLGALFIGVPGILGIAFIINIFALYEYINVIDNKGSKLSLPKILYIILGTSLLVAGYVNPYYIVPALPVLVAAIVMINILSKNFKADYSVYSVFGIMYVSLIISFMIMILRQLQSGEALAVIMFAVVVSVITDSFAYLCGMKFGKNKLCPEISPKKSVEGAIAGFAFGVLSAVVMYFIFNTFNIIDFSLIDCLIMGTINSILNQFGDLTASMVKRNFDVKDYSNLIPGHGGVLDRIDGILFSLAGTFFYITVVLHMLTF